MAVTLTEAQLKAAINDVTGQSARLLEVSTALVLRYAPDAPDTIHNEATIRTAGYLLEQPAASLRTLKLADLSRSYQGGQISALRSSGSMALLSPWKVRRGGLI